MAPDRLSVAFAALADPARRAILARVAQGEPTVMELAEPFKLKLPTVSKHLKVLRRAGPVTHGPQAQWRPRRREGGPLEEGAHSGAGCRREGEGGKGQTRDRLEGRKRRRGKTVR